MARAIAEAEAEKLRALGEAVEYAPFGSVYSAIFNAAANAALGEDNPYGEYAVEIIADGAISAAGGKAIKIGGAVVGYVVVRGGQKIIQIFKGQLHHAISKRIARALDRHPTLKGLFTSRDPRFVTRACPKFPDSPRRRVNRQPVDD